MVRTLCAFFLGTGVVGFNRRLGFLSPDSQSQPARKALLDCFETNRRCTGAALMGRELKYLFYRDAFYNKFQRATDYIMRYVRSGTSSAEMPSNFKDL